MANGGKDITGYSPLLHQKYTKKYPELSDLSQKRLSHQIRVICRSNYITEAKRIALKQRVERDLENSDRVLSSQDERSLQHAVLTTPMLAGTREMATQEPTDEVRDQTETVAEEAIMEALDMIDMWIREEYENQRQIPNENRSQLDRLHNIKKTRPTVQRADSTLGRLIQEIEGASDLKVISYLLYVAAPIGNPRGEKPPHRSRGRCARPQKFQHG